MGIEFGSSTPDQNSNKELRELAKEVSLDQKEEILRSYREEIIVLLRHAFPNARFKKTQPENGQRYTYYLRVDILGENKSCEMLFTLRDNDRAAIGQVIAPSASGQYTMNQKIDLKMAAERHLL